jgi:ubiquinone/menaquinone biosynthesis C-methylase UbiE
MYLSEKEKYERMWRCPEYREISPGLNAVHDFLHHFQGRIKEADTLMDLGCGTGKAAAFFFFHGFSVQLVDIASNCLDETYTPLLSLAENAFRFKEACLWELPADLEKVDWLYCCDVLEHLPEEFVDRALEQMAERTRKGGFLQIFLNEEPFGSLIQESLHLTIRTKKWWIDKISSHWQIEAFGPEIEGFRFSVFIGPISNLRVEKRSISRLS